MKLKQKAMLDPSRAPPPSASFCWFPITSRQSGRPIEGLRLRDEVVVFYTVKLIGSLSPMVLSYVNKTNIFFSKLPLLEVKKLFFNSFKVVTKQRKIR